MKELKIKFSTFLYAPGLLMVIFLVFQSVSSVPGQQTRQLEREKPVTQTEKRIALVIGNGAYQDSPLRNPVNDAADMSAALKAVGFDVTLVTDTNRVDMRRAIREFGEKLRTGGGVGLFYYAGHGVQVKGVNFLIPIGADVNIEEEVEDQGINVNSILLQMEAAKNRMNIVILDACRNNPFARSYRSAEKGLAQIDAPTGTLLAYSTAPGSVASDGTGRNGLYTQELLKQIATPGTSIEDVFKRVRVSVLDLTQKKQTPWESSSLTGDFYFIGNKTAGANDANTTSANSQRVVPETTGASRATMPSAEDILTKYSKAVGFEAFGSINTIIQKGIIEVEGNGRKVTGQIEYYWKRPDSSLSAMVAGNVSSMQGFSGNKGWSYEVGIGSKDLPAEEVEFSKRNNAVGNGDLNLIRRYYPKITFRGIEKLGNKDVYVLEAVNKDGKTEVMYFDTVSMLLSKWDTSAVGLAIQQGVNVLTESYFEDYIDMNGAKTPMTVRQKSANMTLTFKFDVYQAKYNVPLADTLFQKPQ